MSEEITNILVALKIMNISFENLKNHNRKLSTIFDELTQNKKEIDSSTSKTMRIIYLKDNSTDLIRRAHNRYKECNKSFSEINALYETKKALFLHEQERLKDADDILNSARALIESSKKILDDIAQIDAQIQKKVLNLPIIIDTKILH